MRKLREKTQVAQEKPNTFHLTTPNGNRVDLSSAEGFPLRESGSPTSLALAHSLSAHSDNNFVTDLNLLKGRPFGVFLWTFTVVEFRSSQRTSTNLKRV